MSKEAICEVVQKGVYDKDGKRVPVGEKITVPIKDGKADIPSFLLNKVRVLEIEGRAEEGAEIITGNNRLERFAQLVDGLEAEDFNTDGKPKLDRLNALLDEGEAAFTGPERDALFTEAS